MRWLNGAGDEKARPGDDAAERSDPRLARAAMQTLGIATSAAPSAASAATRAARPRIVAILEAHDPARGAAEGDDDDVAVGWQTAYHALLLVEKTSATCPKALDSVGPTDDAFVGRNDVTRNGPLETDHPDAPWRAAQALLTHRHQWVQQAAARVVGRYLAAHGAAMAAETAAAETAAAIRPRPISLEAVARASVAVLEQGAGAGAAELEHGLAEQTVKNLTFASAALLHAAPSDDARRAAEQDEDAAKATTDEDEDENEDEDEDEDDDEDEDEEVRTTIAARTADDVVRAGTTTERRERKHIRPPFPWLFRRLGKVGAGGVGGARAGALKWTAALASSLAKNGGFEKNPSVAAPLVLPAALCADDAVQGVDPTHRALAGEVLDILRGAMPGDLFSRAAAETRARVAGRRDARRRRKALEAVTDPERAARAKMAKARKRAAARKRRARRVFSREGRGESAKKRARDA